MVVYLYGVNSPLILAAFLLLQASIMESLPDLLLIEFAKRVGTADLRNLHVVNRGFRAAVQGVVASLHPRKVISDEGCQALLASFSHTRNLDISDCLALTQNSIQNLGRLQPNLDILNLKGCAWLVDASQLQFLGRLRSLNLFGCSSLSSLPEELFHLPLEILDLYGCSSLAEIPESISGLGATLKVRK